MNRVERKGTDLSQYREQNLSFVEIYQNMENQCQPSVDYLVLILLSTIIASFGLLLNSSAVVIGAMVIAPLMDPILGIALSGLIQSSRLLFLSLLTLVIGILLAILLSYLIGLLFSAVGATPEIIARTKPNIMDLFVALSAGFLGAYAKIRKPLRGTIYGIAISISLLPPLCTIGLGLALNNLPIFTGSTLLFFTNLAGIILSGLIAFLLIDFTHLKISKKMFLVSGISVILLAIPLMLSFSTLVQEAKLKREVAFILKSHTKTFQNIEILKVDIDLYQKPINLTVTVSATNEAISAKQVHLVQNYLEEAMGKPIHLTVNLSPVVQLNGSDNPQKSTSTPTIYPLTEPPLSTPPPANTIGK